MRVDVTEIGTVTVLRMEGDIDEAGVRDLQAAFYQCMSKGRFHLVANLRDVRAISYMGVAVLVERLRKARAFNGDLKLVGLNLYAERLLRMVGVGSLFDIHENESQAVGVFQEAA